MHAEIVFPAFTVQGWAIGLEGKVNINAALAPKETIIHSLPPLGYPLKLEIAQTRQPELDLDQTNETIDLAKNDHHFEQ
jgi:hypothetical protein